MLNRIFWKILKMCFLRNSKLKFWISIIKNFFLLNNIMLHIIRKLFKDTVKWRLFYLFTFIRRVVASFWMCGSLLFFDDFWQIQTPRFRKQVGIFAQKLRFFLVHMKNNFIQIFIKIWDGDQKSLCWFNTEWPHSKH